MNEDQMTVDSGPDTGNAGGESQVTPPPRETGLSLKDSMSRAASSVKERLEDAAKAKPEPSRKDPTALETTEDTPSHSLPDDAGSQQEQASSILEAPKHWPQKRREAFSKFANQPEFVKEWLEHTKELEGEFTRKSQEQAETRKFAESVRGLFAPEQKALLQQQGADEVAAIKWWADLDAYSRKDPAGYAKWFMQNAGLRPEQLFPELVQAQPKTAEANAEADWVDPEILKLREELGSLKSRQQEYQDWIKSQEEARANENRTNVERVVRQFSEAADEDGNLTYPHFKEVENRMAWELANNPELKSLPLGVEKLKAAYDIAVWANPTTRTTMLDAQIAAKQQDAAKRQAAEKAKAAQTLKPKVNSTAGASQVPPSDLKSLIRDAASRAKG